MHWMYFTLEILAAEDLTKSQKQNLYTIKARVSQPVSIFPNNHIGPLVTASCSDLRFTSAHPLCLVRGKSSSFVGELTSMSKQ